MINTLNSIWKVKKSFGEPARLLERQVHSKCHSSSDGNCYGSINIRNAFNSARWKNCIESMMRKEVSDYLLQIIDDYLSERWVKYEVDT